MEDVSIVPSKKTVLIVDDDAAVLSLVAKALAEKYNVLIANNTKEALHQSKEFKNEIHLLLSDLQMAETTRIDLATQITAERPAIKVLLMSGFTGGMLVLNEGWHFLPKPFVPSQLRTLVASLIAPGKSRYETA